MDTLDKIHLLLKWIPRRSAISDPPSAHFSALTMTEAGTRFRGSHRGMEPSQRADSFNTIKKGLGQFSSKSRVSDYDQSSEHNSTFFPLALKLTVLGSHQKICSLNEGNTKASQQEYPDRVQTPSPGNSTGTASGLWSCQSYLAGS